MADAVAEVRTRAGIGPTVEVEVDVPQRKWSLGDVVSVLSTKQGSVLETWEDIQRRIESLDGRALALTPVTFDLGP